MGLIFFHWAQKLRYSTFNFLCIRGATKVLGSWTPLMNTSFLIDFFFKNDFMLKISMMIMWFCIWCQMFLCSSTAQCTPGSVSLQCIVPAVCGAHIWTRTGAHLHLNTGVTCLLKPPARAPTRTLPICRWGAPGRVQLQRSWPVRWASGVTAPLLRDPNTSRSRRGKAWGSPRPPGDSACTLHFNRDSTSPTFSCYGRFSFKVI